MRDRTAAAILLGFVLLAVAGFQVTTSDLPAESTPNATFSVDGDPAGEVVVEHGGGESLESGSLRVLVYEDRPVVPDRTVHGTAWTANDSRISQGDRIVLSDPRFEADQRLVVRWFGDDGQATLHETRL